MLKRSSRLYHWVSHGWQYALRARLYFNLYVRRQTPIAVFQMGKVGSMSVYFALKSRYASVYHVHTMNPENIAQRKALLRQRGLSPHSHNYTNGTFLREHVGKRDRPIHYITAVREPISRNLSAFFETFELYMGTAAAQTSLSNEALTAAFLERFPHERPLTYFDVEYRDTLGIDVYAEPFPHQQGYQRIQQGAADVLILKLETDQALREQALRDYLGWPDLRLPEANVGGHKDYASAYKSFVSGIRLPTEYVDRMLNARYTRHFYTDEERARLRERWLRE